MINASDEKSEVFIPPIRKFKSKKKDQQDILKLMKNSISETYEVEDQILNGNEYNSINKVMLHHTSRY